MKLAISNICTTDLTHLKTLPVDGFESTYGKLEAMQDVEVISVQSLLYTAPHLRIFDNEFISYMTNVIKNSPCKNLVFGSPAARNEGAKQYAEAVGVFYEIGKIAAKYGKVIAIESIPEYMGSEFLTTPEETIKFIKDCDTPGLSFNFDINNVSTVDPEFLCLDTMDVNLISHVHISSSQGQPIHLEPNVDYELAIDKLKNISYNGWVSIEMLRTPNEHMLDTVKFVRKLL